MYAHVDNNKKKRENKIECVRHIIIINIFNIYLPSTLPTFVLIN